MKTIPWERLDGETTKAFDAFTDYRDMGHERSLMKVRQKRGASRTVIERWSREHYWVQRAAAYDKHLDEEWLQAQAARRREAAKRNADLADAAILKLATAVDKFRAKDMTPSAVARLMNATVRMQQLALGGATQQVAVTGPNGKNLSIEHRAFSDMTDEERIERMIQLRDEASNRIAEHEEFLKASTGEVTE